MKATVFILGVLSFSIFIGCTKENSTVATVTGIDTSVVDPQLVGVWSSYNGTTFGYIPVWGMEIGSDKSVRLLGVEFATGKLARMEEGTGNELIRAKDGIIILKHNYCWVTFGDTFQMRYQVGRENLLLFKGLTKLWIPTVMHRSQLESIVTQPTTVMLSAKVSGVGINNMEVKNLAVAGSPSAYMSKSAPSTLVLHAELSYPWGYIEVQIDNFIGARGYGLDMDKAYFIQLCNDQGGFYNYAVDSSAHSVIFIDEYDTRNHRCSGRFVLDFYDGYFDHYVYRLTEGVFSVPIINASQSY